MTAKRIVHVVGTGTIGEPLIGLLATFREQLGIDEVTFHKRTPLLTDRSIAAAEWFLYPEDYEQRLCCIEEHFFSEI